MERHKLSLETLSVDSFATTAPAPADYAAPTRNCETRQTACTVPPME